MERGSNCYARLSDFGLAKLLNTNDIRVAKGIERVVVLRRG